MIKCECGHGIFHHGREGCSYAISHTHKLSELEFCGCELTKQAVEARYWACQMMMERDNWKHVADNYEKVALKYKTERDELEAALKEIDVRKLA